METALLKVANDLLEADREDSTVLILLDLSAALDTVVHAIFIDRLKTWIGIRVSSLVWLLDRTFAIRKATTHPLQLTLLVVYRRVQF